ncbi:MAG: hypothetical protein IH942_03500 [Acidobacteria bacterium]|nr:hypothetical protein [Acidobacteriota bacterium]
MPDSLGAVDGHPPSAGVVAEQRGAILPIMALLLVVLLGVVGFAVDLGWIYWNRIEIQHGADAAALSGVVYASDNPDKAKETGRDVAAINGYIDTTIGGSDIVEIVAYQDDPSAVAHEGQLRATITHEVPTFFMRVFGINSLSIAHTAGRVRVASPDGEPGAVLRQRPRAGPLAQLLGEHPRLLHRKGYGGSLFVSMHQVGGRVGMQQEW